MHADDRQKIAALLTGILLAPRFDPASAAQQDDLRHDPPLDAALNMARAICDAVEDLETRQEAVVFEPPAEVERAAGFQLTGDEPPRNEAA